MLNTHTDLYLNKYRIGPAFPHKYASQTIKTPAKFIFVNAFSVLYLNIELAFSSGFLWYSNLFIFYLEFNGFFTKINYISTFLVNFNGFAKCFKAPNKRYLAIVPCLVSFSLIWFSPYGSSKTSSHCHNREAVHERKRNVWLHCRWTAKDNRLKNEAARVWFIKTNFSNNLQDFREIEMCLEKLTNANFYLNYYVSFTYRANERSKWTTGRTQK